MADGFGQLDSACLPPEVRQTLLRYLEQSESSSDALLIKGQAFFLTAARAFFEEAAAMRCTKNEVSDALCHVVAQALTNHVLGQIEQHCEESCQKSVYELSSEIHARAHNMVEEYFHLGDDVDDGEVSRQ